jgi:uncharacterized protein
VAYFLIPLIALLASGLTLFSGFGLGTLLLPAFAIFFHLDAAIAMTAVVHLLNNLFKLTLLGRHADRGVILRFGLPAILAALVGARLLVVLSALPPLAGKVTWVKLVVGTLMVVFAVVELRSGKGGRGFDRRYLPIGGGVSGFFGGLSGHQGAMRSAFLIRAGLSKEAFIATGVVIACLIDVSRLSVYAVHFRAAGLRDNTTLLVVATLAAFIGAFAGNRLLRKATLKTVQTVVSIMLVAIGVALAIGVI